MSRHKLCSLQRLEDQQSLGIDAKTLEGILQTRHGLFLVYHNHRVSAYLNECPHTGVNLEWQEHDFMDAGGDFIQCTVHGALFKPESGLCVHGPCVNRQLQAVPVEVTDGAVYLALPDCL